MTVEAPVLKNTMLEASRLGHRLFRNNRGTFYTKDGRITTAGLIADGASDLIGPVQITITPEMVGKTIAVFAAVETKRTGWKGPKTKTENSQANFIDFINRIGGFAFFLDDEKNLKKSIDERISMM